MKRSRAHYAYAGTMLNSQTQSLTNPYWWERLFNTIDAGDAAGFVDFLTVDAQFRFGNAPTVHGAREIGAAVTGFFGAIQSSRHRLMDSWCIDESAGCEGEVTYTRHDGSVATFPFANVFTLRGQKVSSYRIYIDISTLFSAAI
jgi:ketosteroid isomerase-like protein